MSTTDGPAGPEQDAGSAEPEMITVYEAVGGMEYFERLIDDFFVRIENDPIIRPMYPDDLTESRRRTALFLAQFWGGPEIYSEERGHPRLRMRHLPFTIGQPEREAWLAHMMAAVDASTVSERPLYPQVRELFAEYFERSSTAMINS